VILRAQDKISNRPRSALAFCQRLVSVRQMAGKPWSVPYYVMEIGVCSLSIHHVIISNLSRNDHILSGLRTLQIKQVL